MGQLVHSLLLFSGVLFLFAGAYEILSEYHQHDYDVKLERCVMNWYNHSFYKYFKVDFVPYNRTQRVLNFSFHSIKDHSGELTVLHHSVHVCNPSCIRVQVQMYKFMSNEYRFFPLTVTVSVCEHFHKNSFGVKDLLQNTSNAGACPWKTGFYYGYNILPDFSKFPPYIPRGAYQMEIKVRQSTSSTLNVDAFISIMDKPLKWNN